MTKKFFLEIKIYLVNYIEKFVIFRQRIVSPVAINLNFCSKDTFNGCSQLKYHLIHLTDSHMSYLIYFYVCNVLERLHN